MTPRDIIALHVPGRSTEDVEPVADAILEALTTAGYRILAPGSLDDETLERAAAVLCDGCAKGTRLNGAGFHEIGSYTFLCHAEAVLALKPGRRALQEERG